MGFAGLGVGDGKEGLVGLVVKKKAIIEHGRGDVGRAAVFAPEDFVGAGDVAPGGEGEGEEGVAFVTAHAKDHAVFHHGTGDGVAGEAGALPDEVAVGEVVAAHFAGGGGDDLRFAAVSHDDRRGPGVAFSAVLFPNGFASLGVEHFDGRLPLMISHDDEFAVVNHGRAAFAEVRAHFHLAEFAIPKFFAVEIVAKQTGGTEPAIEPLAIGGGRGGGKIIVAVRAFVRDQFGGRLAPNFLARFAVEAEHDKLVNRIRVFDAEHALRLILRPRQRGIHLAGIDGGEDENLVAPNDRRGAAVAVNGDFPLDILFLAPLSGRLGGGRNARGAGPAPVMPVVGLGFFKRVKIGGGRGEREAEYYGEEGMGYFHFSLKSQFQFSGTAGEFFSF